MTPPVYKKRLQKLILSLALLAFPFADASAQIQKKNDTSTGMFSTEITGEERAVFAYFRLKGTAPDYEEWVLSSASYKETPKEQQKKFFIRENLRLGYGYGNFDINKDVLEISTEVYARLIPPSEDKGAVFEFRFPNLDSRYEIPSFSFPYGKHEVTLIVEELEGFADMRLSGTQFESIKKKVPKTDEEFMTTIEVHVRPSSIEENEDDLSKPRSDRGGEVFLMGGDVAYLKCRIDDFFSGKELKIWDYVAEWYEAEYREKTMPEEQKYPHPYDALKKEE